MDSKLTRYRMVIKQILSDYVALWNRRPKPNRETVAVLDDVNDHYLIHTIGWEETKRVWNTTLYVRLRDGKFYIEVDWTEQGVATDLLEAGVPKEDIVLAFQHLSMRPYTEFAVA